MLGRLLVPQNSHPGTILILLGLNNWKIFSQMRINVGTNKSFYKKE